MTKTSAFIIGGGLKSRMETIRIKMQLRLPSFYSSSSAASLSSSSFLPARFALNLANNWQTKIMVIHSPSIVLVELKSRSDEIMAD